MPARTRTRKQDPRPLQPVESYQGCTTIPDILPIPAINKSAIDKARAEAITIRDEVVALAGALEIKTPADYHTADDILHSIKVALKRSEQPFEEILLKVRPGMDRLYEVRRAIQNPLLDLEIVVKEKMRAWQIAERERIQAEQWEQARLRREEEERRRLENPVPVPVPAPVTVPTTAPVTAPMIETITLPHLPPISPPTRAASSSARVVERWRVVDMGLLIQAVGLGMVPETVLQVNAVEVSQLFKQDPAVIDTFPGMEVYDDVVISGR